MYKAQPRYAMLNAHTMVGNHDAESTAQADTKNTITIAQFIALKIFIPIFFISVPPQLKLE
jgi:hypothetical protein